MALASVDTAAAARRCADLGVRELGNTGNTAIAIDFATSVVGCAASLPVWDVLTRRELRKQGIARLAGLARDAGAPLSVDDRSTAYAQLVEWLDEAGRHDEARERARQRLALLEEAAAGTTDVERAATFDAHRMECYLYLGEPRKAEELLTTRERELPDDYNPPARLARVLFKQGNFAAAEAAMNRALDKTPRGKRRLGFLELQVDILKAQGRPVTAVRRQQLELYRELPATQRSAKREQEFEKALRDAEGREPGAAR
jgi:tetratricopeptide (TPR) repeat protein